MQLLRIIKNLTLFNFIKINMFKILYNGYRVSPEVKVRPGLTPHPF